MDCFPNLVPGNSKKIFFLAWNFSPPTSSTTHSLSTVIFKHQIQVKYWVKLHTISFNKILKHQQVKFTKKFHKLKYFFSSLLLSVTWNKSLKEWFWFLRKMVRSLLPSHLNPNINHLIFLFSVKSNVKCSPLRKLSSVLQWRKWIIISVIDKNARLWHNKQWNAFIEAKSCILLFIHSSVYIKETKIFSFQF